MSRAALVFDGDRAVAWCEYGTPEELPNVQHNKQYLAFLYNATRSLFEQTGFTYIRSKGLHQSVMRKTVPSALATRTTTRAKR